MFKLICSTGLSFVISYCFLIYCYVEGEISLPKYESFDFSGEEEIAYCDPKDHNRLCCNHDEFQCNQGQCIKSTKVCEKINNRLEGLYDCPDASDEFGCSNLPCKSRTDKCDHLCVDYPLNKSRCACHKGYVLRWSNSCMDINECDIGVHSCSHGCVNLNGSFACTCNKGFKSFAGHSRSNRTAVKTKPNQYCEPHDENILVMFNFINWINWYNVNNQSVDAFIRTGPIYNIDYDPLTDIFYWYNGKSMSRSYLPGAKDGYVTVGHSQTLIIPDLGNNVGKRMFSLDWTTGNIYWVRPSSKPGFSDILVSKVNSTLVKTVMAVPEIRSMAVDPPTGYIFWISGEDSPFIGKCWRAASVMSDSWIITKVFLNGQKPFALAVDHLADGRIYWVDSTTSTIFYMFKTGDTAWTVHTTTRERMPTVLDVFDGYIYWLTQEPSELMRIDKFGVKKPEVLKKDIFGGHEKLAYIMKVYHSSKFDKSITYGKIQCKNCSHFCFYEGDSHGYKCSCPDEVKFVSQDKCGVEQESEPADPLDCNCLDFVKVCDENSTYFNCLCHRELCFGNETDNLHRSYIPNLTSLDYIVIVLFIVLVIVIYILSCFKRNN